MKKLLWEKKYKILFLMLIIIFLIIKFQGFYFKFSDENTYFYMAKMILDGFTPYKDFFFASPPLQIYIISFFMLFVGKHFILLKLIPIFVTIISSCFIFGVVKKKFGEKEGLIASALYLFSFLVLTTTDHSTGIHLSVMFLLGVIYFIYYDKPLMAGIFASFALLTRLYTLFPLAGIGIYLIIFDRKKLLKFIIGCASTTVIVGGLMQLISNGAFLEQIFLFRLKLVDLIGISKMKIFSFFITWDWLLVAGSLLFYFTRKKREFSPFLFVSLFLLIFYFVYSDLYYLYLGLIIPLLCILTAHSLMHLNKRKYFNYIITVLLIFIICFNSFYYIHDHSKAARITFIDEISEFVIANSNENNTLYGSFEITPLIALKTDRRITNNFIDTNPKIFITNLTSAKEMIEKMKEDTKFIFTKVLLFKNEILSIDESVDQEFLKTCIIVKIYPIELDYSSNAVIVWDCKKID
jgi:4-amino-4-deoxy-L-arabinose transferase-like glycosyltransferase